MFESADSYVQAAVRIEGGARPDLGPAEPREIVPYIASEMPDTADLTVSNVTTVKPERTFWEKVPILHAMMEMTEKRRQDINPERPVPDLNRYSRHYYDVPPCPERGLRRDALEIELVDDRCRCLRIAGARVDLDGPGIGVGMNRRARRHGRRQAEIVRGGHAVDEDAQFVAPRDG